VNKIQIQGQPPKDSRTAEPFADGFHISEPNPNQIPGAKILKLPAYKNGGKICRKRDSCWNNIKLAGKCPRSVFIIT
jgi:hypothetical protein